MLGFTGSYHCVAMCGVIAAQTRARSVGATLARHMAYSAGRTLTYVLLAFVLYGLDTVGIVRGGQHAVSLAIGSAVIVHAVLRLSGVTLPPAVPTVLSVRWHGALARVRRIGDSWSAIPRSLVLGSVNGLLPCGFVYMALGGALLQPTPERSIAFMAAFGVGTVPALLFLVLGLAFRPLQVLSSSPRVRLSASVLVGMLLVLRGLSLGIPYVSPSMPGALPVLSSLKHDRTCAPTRP
ncbi:MAG: sulfite exporter TauE/SafE family protein [Candidatus Kapaibacterium sp.]